MTSCIRCCARSLARVGPLLVNRVNTKHTVLLSVPQDTVALTSEPEVVREDNHCHAWSLQLSPDGNIWAGTVNRSFGDAGTLDDVVFPLFPQGGGFPRTDEEKT